MKPNDSRFRRDYLQMVQGNRGWSGFGSLARFRSAVALGLALLLVLAPGAGAYSPNPDLTAAGAIATLKTDTNSSPVYGETFNLGATGLRGWIYLDRSNKGQEGLQTALSRQILVTVASAPGNAVLAVDDVILGALAASSGDVPLFAGDCRKVMGTAIGDAEKTGAGTLRVKRWRAGTISDENITLAVLGDYSATAPYSCPKSALILANAITRLNQQSLSNSWSDAVSALALLAAVQPGDANETAVRAKLATFAQTVAPANLSLSGCDTWRWGYINIFLSEYYLRTVADGSPDATVLHGINQYTVALAKGQSKYGTFGHGGAERQADGSLHGSISWYGPVNSAGLVANIAIVLGKKALLAGNVALDPEIDPAIQRGSKFFAYYVNKGSIPYGEHEPWSGGHASNGKDAMAAVMFGLQGDKPVETEYFTRMSTAGWVGREYGHTGQGFSYLWSALGAAGGGDAAAAAHLAQVRWHLDLERRTDGSFVYDGGEQYGGSSTSTYLGSSSYSGLNPTACFVLTYSLPLKRLLVTGRSPAPASTLDAAKVANAVAAATYERDCTGYSVATLMAALSEYDPVVRHDAAAELGKRALSTAELNTLISQISNGGTLSPDPNVRQGACEALGIRKPASPSPLAALSQRLSDADLWVRAKAANALRSYGTSANSQRDTMLAAFAANATDPDVIVWTDPIQIANGYLADTLFQTMASNTNALTGTARTNLLYPALLAGLKQPDGMARMYLGDFIKNRLSLADVRAVAPGIVAAAAERSPADRMFSDVIRYAALNTLGKYKIEEGIPLCLMVKEQTWHGDDWDPFTLLQNTYRGAAREALPTLYKWQEHIPQFASDGSIGGCCQDRLNNITNKIASTIAAIENDPSPPALVYLKSLTASATVPSFNLPTRQTTLVPVYADQDQGTPRFIWSKVSGAGSVSFTPVPSGNNYTATFNTPGRYVLKVSAVDGSILDYNTWITYSLGYYDFGTYDETLGAVSANVTVTVGPDPNRAPLAENQGLATALNTATPVTLAATDPDGDPLSYIVVSQPTYGLLSGAGPNLLYTPTIGYSGPVSFVFKANDGKVDSAAAAVTIDVGAGGNRRPVAVNQEVTTSEDTPSAIILTGTDADGNPLTYDIVNGPAHGTLSGTAPNLSYQPAANYPAGSFNGSDSFTFTVRDATLTSAVATVTITLTPVNDPPVALAQSATVPVNTAKPIALAGLDPEGYPLLYSLVTQPAHGTLSGTAPDLIYHPTASYRGPDAFTFRVTDSEGVASAVASVSISIPNEAPLANPQSVELPPDSAKAITLTGSDNSNDPLTYAVVSPPANGALAGSAPNLSYTPAAGFTGTDAFTFKVSDGVSDSPAAIVALSVAQWQTWTNVTSGTWSTAASWAGIAPGAGGSAAGLLAFNTTPYAGGSTNDLAGTFQLNRLSFGNVLPALTLSGNPLSLVTNAATLPRLDQNSSNPVTLSHGLTVAANTTLGGYGGGAVILSGKLSGAGRLVKTHSGSLTVSGANTATTPTPVFSGGITIQNGTFILGNKTGCGTGTTTLAGGTTFQTTGFEGNSSGGALTNAFELGGGRVTTLVGFGQKDIWISGPVSGPGGFLIEGDGRDQGLTLAGAKTFSGGVTLGTVGTTAAPNVSIDNASSLGTGRLRSELRGSNLTKGGIRLTANLTTGPGVANPIELAPGARLVVNTQTFNLLLSGPITDAGSLVKIGSGTLTLSGANSFGGTTTVNGGTLTCDNPLSLGQGPVAINSGGAKLNLNFSGTRQVTSLSLAGVAQANGTYGSTSSPAANKNNTYFSGTGTLTVIPATSTTLALTAGATPATPGDPLTFTATVAGSAPTGDVSFHAGAVLIGTTALNGSSQASMTTSGLAAGTYVVTAHYGGDVNHGASTSAALAIHVGAPSAPVNLAATPGGNTVALTWSAASGAIGYQVKRATVSGGPYTTRATISGTYFNDTPAAYGTTYYYVVSGINNTGEGANSAQAAATPVPLPSTTTLASSLGTTGPYNSPVTFTATVGAAAGGSVTFKDGGTVLGTGSLSSGVATFTSGTLAFGTHSIIAEYGGDATYAPSASAAFGYSVTAKPVTITGVTAAGKVYDAGTAATLSGGAVSGVVAGETVTVVPGYGTFASPDVGSHAVTTANYSLGGANAGNYLLSAQPVVANAGITARPVQLAGTRTYDGTTTAAASVLSISNNLDGANLSLTGIANLSGKDVGPRAILMPPARVRSATGNTGTAAASTIPVNLGTAPANGNTLVAVISTRGTSGGRVTGITQSGATWSRATESTGTAGTTTEIWVAPGVSNAVATLVINQASLRSAAVVMEYSGLLAVLPVDKVANLTGNSTTASTGTTLATTQANELWIGGIGLVSSASTLDAPHNLFVPVASSQSTHATPGNNARVHVLERIDSTIGTANAIGTTTSSPWSGAIATLKAAVATSTLALSGPAAGNYTLAGADGSLTITPKMLSITARPNIKIYDGGTSAAALPVTSGLQGTDTVTGLAETYNNANAGFFKQLSVSAYTVNDGNNGNNYDVSLVDTTEGIIEQAPVTVFLGGLSHTYDGRVKSATATTDPAGKQVALTYDPAAAPVNPGSYAVLATVIDPNHTGTASGTMVIIGDLMTAWRQSHFTTEEIAGNLAADGADPDGDGFTNLEEYTFGTHPRLFSPHLLAISPAAGNNVTLSFLALPAAGTGYTDLIRKYDLQRNPDPANPATWQGVSGFTNIAGGGQSVTATLPIGTPKEFYRLSVSVE